MFLNGVFPLCPSPAMAYVHGGLQRCECTSPWKSQVLMMDFLIITTIHITPNSSFTRVLWLMKRYISSTLSVFKAGNHWWRLYDVRKEYYMKLHSGLLDKCLFFVFYLSDGFCVLH